MSDTEPADMTKPYTMLSKVQFIGTFINQIGVPVFLVIVVTGLVVGSWTGYISSPMVTQSAFNAHATNNTELHGRLLEVGNQEVEVLKDIQKEFKAMRCERKLKLDDQVECLGRLSRAPN